MVPIRIAAFLGLSVALLAAKPNEARADCPSIYDCFCSEQPLAVAEVEIIGVSGNVAQMRMVRRFPERSPLSTVDETTARIGFANDPDVGERWVVALPQGDEFILKAKLDDEGKLSCAIDDAFQPHFDAVAEIMLQPRFDCWAGMAAQGLEETECNDTIVLFCSCARPAAGVPALSLGFGLLLVWWRVKRASATRRTEAAS